MSIYESPDRQANLTGIVSLLKQHRCITDANNVLKPAFTLLSVKGVFFYAYESLSPPPKLIAKACVTFSRILLNRVTCPVRSDPAHGRKTEA